MSIAFLTLPSTIWLGVTSELDLKDAVAFTQTCTTLRELADLRSFWAPLLWLLSKEKPLNLPAGQSLSDCDIASLRALAFHRLRLDNNWGRRFPNVYGSVKSIYTNAQHVFAVVSATDIIILHHPEDGLLVCYDTKTTQRTFQLEMPNTIQDFSAPLQEQGQYTIALRIFWPASLHVLRVQHQNGKATGFRRMFHAPLEFHPIYCRPFLYEDVVGIISQNSSNDVATISAFNMKSDERIVLETNLPVPLLFCDSSMVSSFVFGSTIHVAIEDNCHLQVFRCSCSVLPTSSKHNDRQQTAVFEYDGTNLLADSCPHIITRRLGLVPVGTPSYGVAAVSAYEDWGEYEARHSLLRFWPSFGPAERNGDFHLMMGNAKGRDVHIPGETSMCYVANAGTAVFTITKRDTLANSSPARANLVRYVNGTVSMHELRLPSAIDVTNISSNAVDDYKGTVYLLNKSGVLYCIPYA